MTSPVVVLGWSVQGQTGWGLFGLHLGLQLEGCGVRVAVGGDVDLKSLPVPYRGVVERWGTAQAGDAEADLVVLTGLGNNYGGKPEVEGARSVVQIGLAIFEDTALPAEAVERWGQFDRLIVPSRWCQEVLAAKGLASDIVPQGYDHTVWRLADRLRPPSDERFMVFSGGKLEFRKGQDIVVEAFKRFRQTKEGAHAVLVTQWHNAWPQTMEGVWSKGYVRGMPNQTIHGQDIHGWLVANGIPDDAHVELGFVSQPQAALAIRECDAAVFPSRAEGATNMVAAEVLALGVPCILAHNTGQRDLPRGVWLKHQPPVTTPCRLYDGMDGWGESDPDEIVAALQLVAAQRQESKTLHRVRMVEQGVEMKKHWAWQSVVPRWRTGLGV